MDYTRFPFRITIRLGLLTLGMAILFLWSCSESDEKQAKKREFALPVQIGKVVYLDVVDQVRTVGNIQAEQRVAITTEVSGQVSRIAVDEGMKVKRGDLLALIDPREYKLELERLEADYLGAQKEYEKAVEGLRPEDKEKLQAQVNADQSALDLAVKERKRIGALAEEGYASQSDVDKAVDRVRRAEDALRISKAALAAGMKAREEDIVKKKAEMEGIKRRLDVARLDLSKTSIRAPFDGVIISKDIEKGAYVGSGDKIVTMIGSSRLKAVLEMPQSYREKLEKMEGAEFLVRELNLRFKIGKNVSNLVRVIPDANIYSGNIKVQIDLPEPDPSLFPGVNLEALLKFGTRHHVLHVPSISLVISEKGTVVYIMKDKKAKMIPVKAHKERDEFVEVEDFTHQLGPDVDLILRGSGAVFPGAPVFPTNPQPEARPPFSAASKETKPKKEPVETPKT